MFLDTDSLSFHQEDGKIVQTVSKMFLFQHCLHSF